MIDVVALLAICWGLYGMYEDQIKRQPYTWLMKHYLDVATLRDAVNKQELQAIEKRGGCSKAEFRRKIMRPLM